MTQIIETFPNLTFTHQTAFEILKMFLQPFGIHLDMKAQNANSELRFECSRGSTALNFVVECDDCKMPTLAVTQHTQPVLACEFRGDCLCFEGPGKEKDILPLNILKTSKALIDWMVATVTSYMNALVRQRS